MGTITIGTAGWSVPRHMANAFATEGSGLERYASRLPAVEINSSFYRPHRLSTWARWRDSTPAGFRFSVKLPKVITHERRLADFETPLAAFAEQVRMLGEKLAVLLVQLPPSLAFERERADAFFSALAASHLAAIACEPRHASWFGGEADALLVAHRVARVAADPAVCEAARNPGGSRGLSYWRLHGSPVMYRSSYADRLAGLAATLSDDADREGDVWCIFDNTASFAAAADALTLQALTDGGALP